MPVAAVSAVLGRRTCAVIAAGSAALHGVLLGHAANPATGVLRAAMVVACLYCARELWLSGTLRIWCVVAVMNLAMIALHMPAPVHHHTAGAVAVTHSSPLMVLATVAAAVEASIAAAVVYYRTRRRYADIQTASARYQSTRSP